MDRQKAIRLMQLGVKITHTSFTSKEWVILDGSYIVFEDGIGCPQERFWYTHHGPEWDSGYSLWSNLQCANPEKSYRRLQKSGGEYYQQRKEKIDAVIAILEEPE